MAEQKVMQNLQLVDIFYPVGTYYETSDVNFDPNIRWGGHWVEDSVGRVTVAQDPDDDSFDVVGETGGSKDIQAHTHSFTNPSVPNHTHSIPAQNIAIKSQTNCSGSGGKDLYYSSGNKTKYLSLGAHNTNSSGACGTTGGAVGAVAGANTGSSGNLQPYVVVKRWHRIG